MTRHLLVVVAGLLLCSFVPAAAGEQESTDSQATLELRALVGAWIDAEVHGDRAALEEILHEDFLSTFASGRTLNRAEYIDFILGLDIDPFSVTNESVRIHGDTAVVIDVSDDGTTKFTWIAVRREGRWRVIAQTFSGIE